MEWSVIKGSTGENGAGRIERLYLGNACVARVEVMVDQCCVTILLPGIDKELFAATEREARQLAETRAGAVLE